MTLLVQIILFLWCVVVLKSILFWVYLWQLKEYHIGRFMDHFRTTKGKRIFLGYFSAIKLVLFFLLLSNSSFFIPIAYALALVYGIEVIFFIKSAGTKTLKKPVITSKTILLLIAAALVTGLFAYVSITYILAAFWIVLAILLFDILSPLIISCIVLIIQPFFVIARHRVLQKAKVKMAGFKNLTVIAITGSYGKTSTKEFLTTILSSKFKVLSTPDHKNSEMGIAQTILHDLKPEHQIFIVEMGSYNKGGINLLCDMVRPRIGIVTGVNEQHLATFGSMENLLSAEGGRELVKNLPKNGLIILNGDNAHCLDLYKKIYSVAGVGLKKKIYTVAKHTIEGDIWTEDVSVGSNSLSFIVRNPQKELVNFHVNVLGRQNVQNILGAILAAKEFGMSLEEIAQACKKIEEKQAGMTLKSGVHGINVIDSSYSSNPDGVMADLDYLDVFKNKKVIVMPCLIELGSASAQVHRNIGKKIAEVCDLAIITTKDQFENVRAGAAENGMAKEKVILSENQHDIFAHITTFCKEGDTVLLEGGRPKTLINLLNGK